MDTTKIEIIPYELVNEIAYVKMSVENFTLNAHDCWVQVLQYRADDYFLKFDRVYVPPEVYGEWATDDAVIIDFVLDQLGFVRKPEVNIEFPA